MENSENIISQPSEIFIESLQTRNIPLHMKFIASGMHNSDLPPSKCFEIAVVGRSNVGKSSMLNFLAGTRQLARVSNTPGRTQTINLFYEEKEQLALVDLPGYGFALSPKETRAHWETSLSDFLTKRAGLFAVLFLVDVRREINEEDKLLCHWFHQIGLRVLAVQTKCDKVHKSQWSLTRNKQAAALGVPSGMIVSISSEKKMGINDLFLGISGLLQMHLDNEDDPNG